MVRALSVREMLRCVLLLCTAFTVASSEGIAPVLVSQRENSEGVTMLQALESLPEMDDIDSIELYHLRSFHRHLVKSEHSSYSLQTSGLALRSSSTGMVVVLEYRPFDYEASFLPLLRPDSGDGPPVVQTDKQRQQAFHNITGDIFWDTRAVIEYSTVLDIDYWQHSTYLGMINGIVYANYATWISTYMRETPARHFVPHAICSSPSNGAFLDEGSCFSTSQTWDTFVRDSLETFASMSVSMHSMLPPRAAEVQILSNSEPVLVKADPISTAHGKPGMAKRRTIESTLSSGLASGDDSLSHAVHIAASDIFYYQEKLSLCMQGYSTENYISALTSCLPADIAYIHAHSDYYYLIEPRHPFAVNTEYLQVVPAAIYPPSRGVLTSDWVIGIVLLLTVSGGLLLGLRNLKVYEAFCVVPPRGAAWQRRSGRIMDGISMSINRSSGRAWSQQTTDYSRIPTRGEAGADIHGGSELQKKRGHDNEQEQEEEEVLSSPLHISGVRECEASSADIEEAVRGLHCLVTKDTPTVLNVPSSVLFGRAALDGDNIEPEPVSVGTASKNKSRI